MKFCDRCPRHCGVDRKTQNGICGVKGELVRIGRAGLHMWEEPCISGENGSGTIFFAGCNLSCVYCQNKPLSQNLVGKDISVLSLARTMLSLQQKGAHNINFVTPTHYAPEIISASNLAREKGLHIPLVYNTSGYESVETLQNLDGIISVYLTDYKYADDVLGEKYSGVSDYSSVAFAAIGKMFEQVGAPQYDSDGMLVKGVVVRHLLLPGALENAKSSLKRLYKTFCNQVIYSLMNQYTPVNRTEFPELERRTTEAEYDELIEYALSLGITNAFIQEGETQTESFIPVFNGEGVTDDTDTDS